jgi:Na+:H+ antiporter, NhaA family
MQSTIGRNRRRIGCCTMPACRRAIGAAILAPANAGVAMVPEVISGRQTLMFAIIVGLTFERRSTLLWALAIAARLGHYMTTACRGLAGAGFTTSLFIAGHAFAVELDCAAGGIAVFVASCRRIGTALLSNAKTPGACEEERADDARSESA